MPLRRLTGSGLRSTRNAIVPSPCPCAPDVITTQGASDDADQEHSRGTVTPTVLLPPSALNDRFDEPSKLGWHRPAAPDGAVMLVVVELPQAATSAQHIAATTRRSVN